METETKEPQTVAPEQPNQAQETAPTIAKQETLPATSGTPSSPAKVEPKVVAARPVVHDATEDRFLMDSGYFDQAQRVALVMANASITPKHLRTIKRDNVEYELSPQERAANCFLIVNRALRWKMDPFAVMDKTYLIDGKLGYEGQLVAAVVEEHANLRGKLTATYDGTGENRRVTIAGTFNGESEPRTIEWTVKQGRTKNGMWNTNPDQKLWYSGVIIWARRHCPGVILGITTDDDLERIEEQKPTGTVTITKSPLQDAKDRAFDALGSYGGKDKAAWAAKFRAAKDEPVEWWENAIAHIAPLNA